MGRLKKRTKATEACAWKIAQSGGNDWDFKWTLTQETYHDEAETVCHNCDVGEGDRHPRHKKMHSMIF